MTLFLFVHCSDHSSVAFPGFTLMTKTLQFYFHFKSSLFESPKTFLVCEKIRLTYSGFYLLISERSDDRYLYVGFKMDDQSYQDVHSNRVVHCCSWFIMNVCITTKFDAYILKILTHSEEETVHIIVYLNSTKYIG